MKKERNRVRYAIGMLLLISFLITLCYSFGPGQTNPDRKAHIYSLYSVTATAPIKETDPAVKMVLQLFLITSLFIFLLNAFRPKSRKPLLVSCFDRNHFYHHITIHAP